MNKLELKDKINKQILIANSRMGEVDYGNDNVGVTNFSPRIHNETIIKAWNTWVDKNFSKNYQVSEYFFGNKGDGKSFSDEEVEYICTELMILFFSNQEILDMINSISGSSHKLTSNNLIENYEARIVRKEKTINHLQLLYSIFIFNNKGEVIREVWLPVKKEGLRSNYPMRINIKNNNYRLDSVGDHIFNFMLMFFS